MLNGTEMRRIAAKAAEYMHSHRQAAYSTAPWSDLPEDTRNGLIDGMLNALFQGVDRIGSTYQLLQDGQIMLGPQGKPEHHRLGTQQGAEELARRRVEEGKGEITVTVNEVRSVELCYYTARITRTVERMTFNPEQVGGAPGTAPA